MQQQYDKNDKTHCKAKLEIGFFEAAYFRQSDV
jgi:hypothetical protein